MVTWFAGQRIKLKKKRLASTVPIGAEGVISAIRSGIGHVGLAYDCEVIFDGFPSPTGAFGLSFWQIDPILPEGAQPSEFSFTKLMDNLGVVVA